MAQIVRPLAVALTVLALAVAVDVHVDAQTMTPTPSGASPSPGAAPSPIPTMANPPENPLITARVRDAFLAWQRGHINRSTYSPQAGGTYIDALIALDRPDLEAIDAFCERHRFGTLLRRQAERIHAAAPAGLSMYPAPHSGIPR